MMYGQRLWSARTRRPAEVESARRTEGNSFGLTTYDNVSVFPSIQREYAIVQMRTRYEREAYGAHFMSMLQMFIAV